VIERYYVTGTDTEVGKTVASTALLQAARLQGRRTAGYKPVASVG
jgi:dethiobiotin synthetase